MVLDLRFIISGLIIILALIPLYIYRKTLFKGFYKAGSLKAFMKDMQIILKNDYPKISFNFDILAKYEDEKNIRVKEILIVEDFVRQFCNHEYELNTQPSVSKEKLWSSYEQNSTLHKDNKYPIDWNQRKEAAWSRDHKRCNRCGTTIKLIDAQTLLAKQMKNGGGFNLENIIILCQDCSRIVKSTNIEKTSKDLHVLDRLMRSVDA
ncbi:MAG: HNH endonuclease [Halarcobacter sp.]